MITFQRADRFLKKIIRIQDLDSDKSSVFQEVFALMVSPEKFFRKLFSEISLALNESGSCRLKMSFQERCSVNSIIFSQ